MTSWAALRATLLGMSAAVAVGRPPLPFPPEMLEHLGITAKHLEALGVLDLSLEDAVARGVIRLPPPLMSEQFPNIFAICRTSTRWG